MLYMYKNQGAIYYRQKFSVCTFLYKQKIQVNSQNHIFTDMNYLGNFQYTLENNLNDVDYTFQIS